MFWNGSTAIEGLSGSASCADSFSGAAGSACGTGVAGWDADLQRVNPDRLGDVLELGFAEIANCEIEPTLTRP